jgi:hypothetical protein
MQYQIPEATWCELKTVDKMDTRLYVGNCKSSRDHYAYEEDPNAILRACVACGLVQTILITDAICSKCGQCVACGRSGNYHGCDVDAYED